MRNWKIYVLVTAMCLALTACGKEEPQETKATEAPAVTESQKETEKQTVKETEKQTVEETEASTAEELPENPNQVNGSADEYVGMWEYTESPYGIIINADNTFEYWGREGMYYASEWELIPDGLVLYNQFGEEETTLSFGRAGILFDRASEELYLTEAFSFVGSTVGDAAGFIGMWEYAEYPAGYVINADNTYECWGGDGTSFTAQWEILQDCMVLYNEYGGEETTLVFTGEGTLWDRNQDVLYATGAFSFQQNSYGPAGAGDFVYIDDAYPNMVVGPWRFQGYDFGMTIYEDGTYSMEDGEGNPFTAEWKIYEGSLIIYNQYGGEDMVLHMNQNGSMIDDAGRVLVYAGHL